MESGGPVQDFPQGRDFPLDEVKHVSVGYGVPLLGIKEESEPKDSSNESVLAEQSEGMNDDHGVACQDRMTGEEDCAAKEGDQPTESLGVIKFAENATAESCKLKAYNTATPPSGRRKSSRKRKSTPVYHAQSISDDPLGDLDDVSEDDVPIRSRSSKKRRRSSQIRAKKSLSKVDEEESWEDEYTPSEADDILEHDDTEHKGHAVRIKSRPIRRKLEIPKKDTNISMKKKNLISMGSVNMEKWNELKKELGISGDSAFTRRILDYCEENKGGLKSFKNVKVKEEILEDAPKSYNPHAEESDDPFVCISTNWDVKRWYLELVSHAKRSPSGFLAHLLRLYCRENAVDLPQNNTLMKYDMEFELMSGGQLEEICACDGNDYTMQEMRVDTLGLVQHGIPPVAQNNVEQVQPSVDMAGNKTSSSWSMMPGDFASVEKGPVIKAVSVGHDKTAKELHNPGAEQSHSSTGSLGDDSAVLDDDAEVDDSDDNQSSDENDDVREEQSQKKPPLRLRAKKIEKKARPIRPPDISPKDYVVHELPADGDLKKKYYECAICHKIYKSNSIFVHIRIHKGEKKFCGNCGKHSVNGKVPVGKVSKGRKCRYCDFEGVMRQNLKEHMKEKHPQEVAASKRFLCEECGRELKAKSSLKEHRKTHLPQIRNIVCDICGKAFTSRRFLQIHINGVHGNKSCVCTHDGCNAKFNTQSMLRVHFNRVHLRLKKVTCTIESCKRDFFTKSEMQQHIRVYHTKEKLFSCTWDGCGKTFRTPYQLQVHMRIHTDEKPLKCPNCDYRARQRNALNWHMKKCGVNANQSALNQVAHGPKSSTPRIPKPKNLPLQHHEEPQMHHQPHIQIPYHPHPHAMSNQYEFNGIPPNPYNHPAMDNNNYNPPYPAQSVFPPGSVQYQSL